MLRVQQQQLQPNTGDRDRDRERLAGCGNNNPVTELSRAEPNELVCIGDRLLMHWVLPYRVAFTTMHCDSASHAPTDE